MEGPALGPDSVPQCGSLMARLPLVLLVQLPIPPAGLSPAAGNIPLAAGYLKMLARRSGLEQAFRIELFPTPLANVASDQGLVAAIAQREPAVVGFTCYLWNIDRTLWIARQLKQRDPRVIIVLGGPEITPDNQWVLADEAVDYAAIGEGEQTFRDLLAGLAAGSGPVRGVPGLWSRAEQTRPAFRQPISPLDLISSPYLEGILDAADQQTLLLETTRGCVFKCKFCYYPKSYDRLYFLSPEKIEANLAHARQRGVKEVFLLDPTLNQRRDFDDLLRLLAQGNPERQFTYAAELRAEGIKPATAALLREANFVDLEIGLQSTDPSAQQLMDRKTNLKAFERGVRAMMDEGIHVKVDLIIGLPGDTPDTIRASIDYLHRSGCYSSTQVFNLSVLPGTSFRHEAQALGLVYQPFPPYYVTRTPTLSTEQMVDLMAEAQEVFGTEFDALPAPRAELPGEALSGISAGCRLELDQGETALPPADRRAQAFMLWLRSADFDARHEQVAKLVRTLVGDNPHSTLEIVLEPTAGAERLGERALPAALAACFESTSYLDRYYSLNPDRLRGAKRLVVLLPAAERAVLGEAWVEEMGQFATLAWQGDLPDTAELFAHEYALDAAT